MRNRIRELRKAAGLTQDAMATAIGVSRQTAISLETAAYNPSVELALHIARLFGTTVEEVYQLDDHAKPADAR